MKRYYIFAITLLGVIYSGYSQNIELDIGNTGYYLILPRREAKNSYLHFGGNFLPHFYWYKDELGDYEYWENYYENYDTFVLTQSWDKCDHDYLGMIYFSDSALSDFDKFEMVKTLKTNIFDRKNIFNIFLFSYKKGENSFNSYFAEAIISEMDKYMHIIVPMSSWNDISEKEIKKQLRFFLIIKRR